MDTIIKQYASEIKATFLEPLTRNKEIQKMFKEGCSIEELTEQYGLAYSTIKKIIYG